jgi:hypothetical protein
LRVAAEIFRSSRSAASSARRTPVARISKNEVAVDAGVHEVEHLVQAAVELDVTGGAAATGGHRREAYVPLGRGAHRVGSSP